MIDTERRDSAKRRTDAFWRRVHSSAIAVGQPDPTALANAALDLASHAALAVALDPKLLNLLRVNFFLEHEPLPYWTEAPLLLSSLCRDEGDGLFVMESAVRDLLLTRLASEHGAARIRQVAALLWQYAERDPGWADRKELRHAQQITALNFIDPVRAGAWLEEAQQGAGDDTLSKEWFVAMQAQLPDLPQIGREGGDAQAVCDALMTLGYGPQVEAYGQLPASGPNPDMVFIQGASDRAPLWLLYRLLRPYPRPALFELRLTASMSRDIEAFSKALAAAMRAPYDRRWFPAIDRLTDAAQPDSPAVLTFSDAHRINEGSLISLLMDVAGMIRVAPDRRGASPPYNVCLVLIGDPLKENSRFPGGPIRILPPIEPFSLQDITGWIDTNHSLLKVEPSGLATSLFNATAGLPEPTLQRLCAACGVRWKDVLLRARSRVTATPSESDSLAELARNYDAIRKRMPSSHERTAEMERIIARMREQTRQRPSLSLEALMNSPSAGSRLAAIAGLQTAPRASELAWLALRFGEEKPFVEYHTILALAQAALKLSSAELPQVEAACEVASRFVPPNTDRARALESVRSILRRRPLGLQVVPLFDLRDLVMLPGATSLADLREPAQEANARRALQTQEPVFAVFAQSTLPAPPDRYRIGVTCRVTQVTPLETGPRVRLQGLDRYHLTYFPTYGAPDEAVIEPDPDEAVDAPGALIRLTTAMMHIGAFWQVLSPVQRSRYPQPPRPPPRTDYKLASLCYNMCEWLGASAATVYSLLAETNAAAKTLLLQKLLQAALSAVEPDAPDPYTPPRRWRDLRDTLAAAQVTGLIPFLPKFAVRPRSKKPRTPTRNTAGVRDKLWPVGSTVRINLTGGSAALQKTIQTLAREWTRYANLKFAFVKTLGDAEIRVVLTDDKTSWSMLGTDALAILASGPTMSLGVLNESLSPGALRATVLRQFGHALGLINEQQNPNAHIPWDRDAMLKELRPGWTLEAIERNFLEPAPLADYRAFDPKSIMMFDIPPGWTLDRVGYSANSELSPSDKAFIASLYPPTERSPTTQGSQPKSRAPRAPASRPKATRTKAPGSNASRSQTTRAKAPGRTASRTKPTRIKSTRAPARRTTPRSRLRSSKKK